MFEFLRKPSPNLFSFNVRLIMSFAISIFVFLFLLIFQPFGVFEYLKVPNHIASLGFGGIALVFNLIFLFGWNEWLTRKYDQRWTMWRQLLSIFVHVSIIGVVNFFYSDYVFRPEYADDLEVWERLVQDLFFAHSIAFIPTVFMIAFAELKLSQHYSMQSESIASKDTTKSVIQKVKISIENSEIEIMLSSDTFRFAKASGNYVEFYYSESNSISKDLQRITLSKFEEQIANSSLNVMKTHRSYIVNMDAIESVQGNAQGYLLSLSNTEERVPVARNKVVDFNDLMNG